MRQIKEVYKEGYVDGYADGINADESCVPETTYFKNDFRKAWNRSQALALPKAEQPNLWLIKDYLKTALNRWNVDGKHWVEAALKELEGTEQPPASDFTKECRELRKKGATSEQWEYATKLGEACDIIDTSEASRKEPLKALEMIKTCLLTHGEWDDGCFYYAGHSASELEEPLNLIKAAIEKQS